MAGIVMNSRNAVELIARYYKLNIRYHDVLLVQDCACCSSRGVGHDQRPRRRFDLRADQRVYETSVVGEVRLL